MSVNESKEQNIEVPIKYKFNIGDIVVSKDNNLYGTPQYRKAGEIFTVRDVIQCEKCKKEYINIRESYKPYSSIQECPNCNNTLYNIKENYVGSDNFESIYENRKKKLMKIKYNSLSPFGKIKFNLLNKIKWLISKK